MHLMQVQKGHYLNGILARRLVLMELSLSFSGIMIIIKMIWKEEGIIMAEYQMSYLDLLNYVEDSIASVKRKDSENILNQHKAEIMCALTINLSNQSDTDPLTQVQLWENQLKERTKSFVINNYVFKIKDIILVVLKLAISTGLIEGIINDTSMHISKGALLVGSIAMELYDYFQSVGKLNNRDSCVYYRILEHISNRKSVLLDSDVYSWFASNENCKTSAQYNDDCDYLMGRELCAIKEEDIKDSLQSLFELGILKSPDKGKIRLSKF